MKILTHGEVAQKQNFRSRIQISFLFDPWHDANEREDRMSSLRYDPSGKLPPTVVFWALVAGIGLLPIGWTYAWLNHFAPPGPLSLLYAIGFISCCARAAYLAAKWGKARNPGGMALIGASIGFIGWYGQWVAWLSFAGEQPAVAALFNGAAPTMLDIATAPGRMYAVARQIKDAHLIVPKSPDYAWLLEFLCVTSLSALCGYGKAIAPFCETGDKWGEIVELPKKYAFITDEAEFVKLLELDPRDTLDTLTSFPEDHSGFSSIQLVCCRPSEKAYLTVNNTEISTKDGTKKEKQRSVVSNLSINLALADDLISQCANGGSLLPAPSEESGPPELQPAIDHLSAGNYEAAVTCAAPYLASPQARLRNDAIRLSALASSRTERWDAALGFWRSLFDLEASAHNALQVATASVMAGQVPHGEQWMRTAVRLNETSGDCPWMLVTTNFITALKKSGNAGLALPYLNEVKAIYEKLHITDPTFLFMRGVPNFSAFLDNSRAVLGGAMSANAMTQWYESMLPHIDSGGQTELREWLEAGMPAFPSATCENGQPATADGATAVISRALAGSGRQGRQG